MNKVHRPDVVEMRWLRSVSPQLCLDPALGNLVAELKAHLLVKAIDSFRIDSPAVTPEQNMDTTVSIADTSLADVLDLQLQFGLLAVPGLVDLKRPVDLQNRARAPDRDLPVRLDHVDKLAFAGRPQSFF